MKVQFKYRFIVVGAAQTNRRETKDTAHKYQLSTEFFLLKRTSILYMSHVTKKQHLRSHFQIVYH